MSLCDSVEMKGTAKRKSDVTGRKAILADHKSKEDRPTGTIPDNDLESKSLDIHPR